MLHGEYLPLARSSIAVLGFVARPANVFTNSHFDRAGNFLYLGTYTGSIYIVNSKSLETVSTIRVATNNLTIRQIEFSRDGR